MICSMSMNGEKNLKKDFFELLKVNLHPKVNIYMISYIYNAPRPRPYPNKL